MTRLPAVFVTSCALALGLGGSDALAQGGEREDGDKAEEAKRLFAAGEALEASGQMEEACRLYRVSLQKLRVAGPLVRSGRCDAREGKILDAIAKYDEMLASLPAENPKRSEYVAERDQWRSQIARLTVVQKKGSVGYSVTIDTKPARAWGEAQDVDPGKRVIVVRAPDGAIEERIIEIGPGASSTLEVPFTVAERPVAVRLPQRREEEGLSGPMIGAIVAFSVGGAGAIATAVTGGLVVAADAEAQDVCAVDPSSASCREQIEDGTSLLAPNLALWIVSGVAVATGVTLVIVDAALPRPGERPRDAARLQLRLGPAGATLSGRF